MSFSSVVLSISFPPHASGGFTSQGQLDASHGLTMAVPATPTRELEALDAPLYASAVRLFYSRAQEAGLIDVHTRVRREMCLLQLTS